MYQNILSSLKLSLEEECSISSKDDIMIFQQIWYQFNLTSLATIAVYVYSSLGEKLWFDKNNYWVKLGEGIK